RVESEMNGVDAAVAKAHALAKDDPDDVYDLVSAELYEKAGRPTDAVVVIEKAVASRPSDDRLVIALARLYGLAGGPAQAEGGVDPTAQGRPEALRDKRGTRAAICGNRAP